MTHGGASRPTSRGPSRTRPGGLAEFRECSDGTRAAGKGAGRAFGPAARLLQAAVLFSLRRPRTQTQGSLRVCGYNYLTEANFRSSYSLFKSLRCHPRIKSKVLSSVSMTLHNQATTYLSSSISLKVNYCCLPLTHHFLFFLPMLFRLPGMPITVFLFNPTCHSFTPSPIYALTEELFSTLLRPPQMPPSL